MAVSSDPCTIARRYAERVAAGKIPAGKWLRFAAQRHLADLKRWGRATKRGSHPYRFSPEHARHAIQFIERTCRHVEGRSWKGLSFEAGERIRLEPWQQFILCVVFGWLRTDDGMRRFRYVYLEVGRKNAKSTLTAALSLYMLLADGEPGAQIYSAATTYTQAAIVWGIARRMAERSPALHRRLGPHRSRALSLADGSIFRPVHAKALSQEGFSPHFASMDELHAHRTPEIWNVFRDGMGARAQPLQWGITTAGTDTSGICYEQRLYGEHVLQGSLADEAFAAFIFAADEGDAWDDERTWRKANPNLGVSVGLEYLRGEARLARSSPAFLADFQTKHLCVWVGAGTPYIPLDRFDAGADPALKPEAFAGCRCWISVDLAARFDVAGFDILFERDGLVYDFHHLYLPRGVTQAGGSAGSRLHAFSAHLLNWAGAGHLTLTEGDVIDHGLVKRDLLAAATAFSPEEIAFDPWSPQMMIEVGQEGLPVVALPQQVQHFSPALKEWVSLLLEGRYRHPGNPMVRWMASNVHAQEDWKGNVFPRKEKKGSAAKIDASIMTVMSLNRRQVSEGDGGGMRLVM